MKGEQGLRFVAAAGGTARGVGRCGTTCSSDAPPALPDSIICRDGACELPSDYDPAKGWCSILNDDGTVQVKETPRQTGYFAYPGWGPCTEKLRLPGAGFDYEPEEMERIAGLSHQELIAEVCWRAPRPCVSSCCRIAEWSWSVMFAGCGRIPLQLRGNAASRNGGGLFKEGCNVMADREEECVLEGMHGQLFALFHDNSAA
eukprot:2133369-Rhodomonas_salina.1